MSDWSDEELEASVVAYRDMQRRVAASKAFTKKDVYRELAATFGRTEKAYEFRMQNISSVLNDQGQGWLKGLPPAAKVGAYVRPRIEKFLGKHPITHPKPKSAPQPVVAPAPAAPAKIMIKEAAYKAKLTALRRWLIEIAKHGRVVTYSQARNVFAIDRFSLAYALGILGREAKAKGEPILTAVVVSQETRMCGEGFTAEFQVDDALERTRLYAYWGTRDIEHDALLPTATFEERVSRFVSVEARPDQAAFRRRVFEACDGKCVVTGCDIVQVLDAAHRTGRNWRAGQNEASDGFVMRKDIHALYDAGLLGVTEAGLVVVSGTAILLYGIYHGTRVTGFGKG